MGQPAARKNDPVVGIDIHVVMVPAPSGAVPTPLPHPFSGTITGGTIGSVKIGGQEAAVVGSEATNKPSHIPTPPGTSFQKTPSNKGKVDSGSQGDPVKTCNDPVDADTSAITAGETTVMIG